MILNAIQNHLQATCMPPFRSIEDAGSFSAVKNSPQGTVAYVVPISSQGQNPVRMTGVTRQTVNVQFGIVIFARRHGDVKGGAKANFIQDLRDKVSSALLGWKTGDYDPISYGKGSLLQLENSEMWWMDEYQTSLMMSY